VHPGRQLLLHLRLGEPHRLGRLQRAAAAAFNLSSRAIRLMRCGMAEQAR